MNNRRLTIAVIVLALVTILNSTLIALAYRRQIRRCIWHVKQWIGHNLCLVACTILFTVGCSREDPRPSMAPVKPAPIQLGKTFDLWATWKCGNDGQREKMIFSANTNSPHSGSSCLHFINGNDKTADVFMTAAYSLNRLRPGASYQFTCFVRNDEGAPYHLFICDHDNWDNRTHCDQQIWEKANGPKSWQMWSHIFKADKDGYLIIRLVMETKGAVSVDDCKLEEYR